MNGPDGTTTTTLWDTSFTTTKSSQHQPFYNVAYFATGSEARRGQPGLPGSEWPTSSEVFSLLWNFGPNTTNCSSLLRALSSWNAGDFHVSSSRGCWLRSLLVLCEVRVFPVTFPTNQLNFNVGRDFRAFCSLNYWRGLFCIDETIPMLSGNPSASDSESSGQCSGECP